LRTDKFRPVEQSFAVEEQQPILRPALRREEKQRQLIRRQHLLLIQMQDELAVTLGYLP
jgi:hypothetical protein